MILKGTRLESLCKRFFLSELSVVVTEVFVIFGLIRYAHTKKRNREPTPEEWKEAKEIILAYLHGFPDEEQDKKNIAYGGRMLSIRDLAQEVENETELGFKHIHMYFQSEILK
jgi:hypothetical protein